MIQDSSIKPQSLTGFNNQDLRSPEPPAEPINQSPVRSTVRSTEFENEQDNVDQANFRDELNHLQTQRQQRRKLESSLHDETAGISGASSEASQTTAAQSFPSQLAASVDAPINHVPTEDGNWGNVETVDLSFSENINRLDQVASPQLNSNNEAALEKTARLANPSFAPTNQAVSDQEASFRLVLDSGLESSTKSQPEPVAPSSGFQSDLPDSSHQPFETNREGLALEPTGRFIAETAARTDSLVSTATEIGRAVSQRVSEVMVQELQLAGNNEFKQITLHLHPAELGKLTLQVGWESDSIIARIVASELATRDMLNNDKSWLIDTLQASGLELDSFEISHGGTQDEQEFGQKPEPALTTTRPDSDSAKIQSVSHHVVEVEGSIVNLIA